MPEKYDGETCEGCTGFDETDARCLGNSRVMLLYDKACPDFVPSLECRKVRALERLHACLENQPILVRDM